MPELTPDAWAQIRHDYEQTDRPVEDICVEHGFTANTLRHRARKWGWKLRRPRIPAEGPPAVILSPLDVASAEHSALGPRPRLRGDMLSGDERGESLTACASEEAPTPTLPRKSGGGRSGMSAGEVKEHQPFAATYPDIEPSPHIGAPITPAIDSRPIGQRLQGAVGRVLPAIEATLARLADGPARPREMEMAARALGLLMRTLRELNGLLGQHATTTAGGDPPPENMDDFRNALARRIEVVIERHEAEIPARYEAAWNEFAAEARQ